MSKDNMALTGGGVAALVGLMLLLFARKAKAATPPPEGEAGFGITIGPLIDAETGLPVPSNSPDTVVEGHSYILPFTVTNGSIRLGAPVAADLGIIMAGLAGSVGISFPAPFATAFRAGETLAWNITFTVPDGTGGQAGEIRIRLNDPSGNQLALGIKALGIQSAAITYGATITFGAV